MAEKCNKLAEAFIPRWGMYFSCVLEKGHEGSHRGGGNCFTHGEYVGISGCPICVSHEIYHKDGIMSASNGLPPVTTTNS
jgi:hypothetical protein